MTSHPTCNIGPYWNTEMCDHTGQWINTARQKRHPTEQLAVPVQFPLSCQSWGSPASKLFITANYRVSHISCSLLHHRPNPSCTHLRLTDGRLFYSWNFILPTKIRADDCFSQTMQPETQDVASSELWTVTFMLNICLQRSSNNESLVMPVTELYYMRNWRLMYGVGIRSWKVRTELKERTYVMSRLELDSTSSEQGWWSPCYVDRAEDVSWPLTSV